MQQANLMAFIDAFRVFALACIVIIPLIFLIKGIKKEVKTLILILEKKDFKEY